MTSLSVIIPATDRRPTLDAVTRAIEHAAQPPEELIIVDSPEELGPAAARNLGARRARGDVLVFVDADVEVHEDALVHIRHAFENNVELSAVFGSYDDDPGASDTISRFRNLLHHHVHHQHAGVATTFWTGLGAIRRDVFVDLGGFDEERFPRASVEDIELGMRLHACGGLILLDPAIQGKHLKKWTIASMMKTDLLRRGVPWLRLLLERRTRSTTLNLGWSHRIAAGASLLVVTALLSHYFWFAAGALTLLIALDRKFYGLLFRRGGPILVAAGVPLHVLHRLVSATAIPIALTAHVSTTVGRRVGPRPDRADVSVGDEGPSPERRSARLLRNADDRGFEHASLRDVPRPDDALPILDALLVLADHGHNGHQDDEHERVNGGRDGKFQPGQGAPARNGKRRHDVDRQHNGDAESAADDDLRALLDAAASKDVA